MVLDNQETQEKWRKFRETGDRQSLNALVEAYYPLLERVATTVIAKRRTPRRWDKGDLINSGVFSLISLIKNYRADRGLTFEKYAFGPLKMQMAETMGGQTWNNRWHNSIRVRTERLRILAVQRLQRPVLEDEFEAMKKAEGISWRVPVIAQIVEQNENDENLPDDRWLTDPGKRPIDMLIQADEPRTAEMPYQSWQAFFEAHAGNSFIEVAEKLGVARTSVHDTYRRCKPAILSGRSIDITRGFKSIGYQKLEREFKPLAEVDRIDPQLHFLGYIRSTIADVARGIKIRMDRATALVIVSRRACVAAKAGMIVGAYNAGVAA